MKIQVVMNNRNIEQSENSDSSGKLNLLFETITE